MMSLAEINYWRMFHPTILRGATKAKLRMTMLKCTNEGRHKQAQLLDLLNTWSKCKPPNFQRDLCSKNSVNGVHWHETFTLVNRLTSSLMWWPLNWWWLYLADAAEHKRLSLVIPVGSHSQVHLLWAGVFLEGLTHSQNGIRRAHLHSAPPWAAI